MIAARWAVAAGLVTGAVVAMLIVGADDPAASRAPHAIADRPTTTQPTGTPSTPRPEPVEPPDLAAAAGDATIGVAVYDRERADLVLTESADRQFTSASLVKLLIALEALERGDAPGPVRRMLSGSDDQIASALWMRHGDVRIVTRWADRMGLAHTQPPADPGRWGDTRTTARDVVSIYRHLYDDVDEAARETVLAALREATPTGSSDGFDQYFGIPDAAGDEPWAVKQGWSCCRTGKILHTTGVVGERYLVAVLTQHPATSAWAAASRRTTKLTSAVLATLR
ncbi:serine hydrolase [Amycolatopsis suaedae]|uniref:Beta-lactamase class A catalytic domain-containing protein n=1 Tax=Amycolatopsis suaedae TaxID=2510978 RepID=A0A4Q7IZ39_9PSEU|nr:serine hydrolase [Amycolatopsis suaedae]RZQ59542.1 hypothetical protein EWH70_33690 [Amycolatopsis suaedae]